ncbi:Pentatricopeptide repeat-containing protein [Cynara cardunculus var. scolymus]|uniref:Pentatricopeptide repeat-containing protein n=2 Tax=Cynara cardunculus var. scolymus TaxID=59895 RepID=A0A103Y2G7_CYNCS|nr:Pentatricopeptide repeat-containing protein [Cynara cardunculus var. scolymus]
MIGNAVETCSTATVKTLSLKCKTLNQFKQLHAHLIKSHLPENPIAIGPLLSAAATSNNPSFFSYARLIFNHLRFRNTFMYNTMIRGYLQNDDKVCAIICYTEMLKFGLVANNYTFPPLIKACSCSSIANAKLIGCSVHGHVMKLGIEDDRFVGSALIEFYSANFEIGNARKLFDEIPVKDVVLWTTLIDGYGKNEDVKNAHQLFDEMPQRNVISWSSIMAAYSRVSDFENVISLFTELQDSGIKPNESILVSVLTACAHLGALAQGLWVHSYAKRHNLSSNPILATALVDMYSKCGCTDLALSVFNTISVKDMGAWNAIISGMAMNGEAKTSLQLLDQMASIEIQPTPTTFVAILTACTHAKLVKEGLELFNRMEKIYGVEPQFEHYACVVDLLARAGMLEEAMDFVEKKLGGVGKGDANVWGAVLGACRTYGNVGIGNRVWRKLVEIGVSDYGIYVVSYNMYKEAGWKREAEEVRRMIARFGMKKTPGCSMVEVDGMVKEFVSGDISHFRAPEIHKTLESLFNVSVSLNLTGTTAL